MAGENAELTFVRCPSCRSLVPAISTKCRMCGATFDSNNQQQEEKPRAQSGRVRQQTTSMASNGAEEMDTPTPAAATPARPTPPAFNPGVSTPFPPKTQQSSMGDIDDPLRGYVEEVSVDSKVENKVDPLKFAPKVEVKAPQPKAPVMPPPTSESPKVVVESGKGRPGGLSFSKPESKEVKREPVAPTPPAMPAQELKGSPKPEVAPRPHIETKPADVKPKEQPRMDRPEQSNGNNAPRPQRQNQVQSSPSHRPAVAKGNGTLVGWLVDFRDGKGQGVELREGQFFITRSKLKDNDLILDHDSVSTPHAMVRVTEQNGIEVQDLMSERGVSVQKSGVDGFKAQEERIRLAHGDRIRFGEIEYLVVLIPQRGK